MCSEILEAMHLIEEEASGTCPKCEQEIVLTGGDDNWLFGSCGCEFTIEEWEE
jgi:hypothetical protein